MSSNLATVERKAEILILYLQNPTDINKRNYPEVNCFSGMRVAEQLGVEINDGIY